MSSDTCRRSVVQHDDLIRILHGRRSLGDDKYCRISLHGANRPAQCRICSKIQRRRAVVKDQNIRLPHKSSRDGKTLLLSSRQIAAALLDPEFQPARFPVYKLFCLGDFQRLFQFLFRGVFISPAQILRDSSFEQDSFLKHDSDARPQTFYLIFPDIISKDSDLSACSVIKPRNQIDQRRFS